MTVENLLRSVTGNYLHFNRVDSYSDFPNADGNDGQRLPKDQPANSAAKFQKATDFSAANYYDQSRARTYACCFSVENSDYIWKNYASGSEKGKVCVVFVFGKLRAMLNRALNPEGAALIYDGNLCRQIFSVNYGLVNYVDWDNHQTNDQYLSNPILYTYIKDAARFCEETRTHGGVGGGAVRLLPMPRTRGSKWQSGGIRIIGPESSLQNPQIKYLKKPVPSSNNACTLSFSRRVIRLPVQGP